MSRTDKKIDNLLKESQKSLKEEMEIYGYEDDDYDKRRRRQSIKKKKQKKKTRIKIAVLVAEIFVILALTFGLVLLIMPNGKGWLMNTPFGNLFLKSMLSKESYNGIVDKDYDRENTGINEGLDTSKLDDYLNIALFGLDARHGELEGGVQSDCIIIVSINKETKEVKMASIYRDTYARIFDSKGNSKYGKINAAYAMGGPAATVKTLNTNYDLNIKDYVSINFDGIAEIIDLMGGIDINITASEASYINGIITSYYQEIGEYDKMYTHQTPVADGLHHLDGVQATAYCRIRKTAVHLDDGTVLNDDFGRTARQRLVLNRMIDRAKAIGVDAVMEMAEVVFESENKVFLTSIPYEDVIELIPIVLEFQMNETKGYPDKWVDKNFDLVPDNLAQMVVDMHQYLFGNKTFKPSKTVQGINEAMCSMMGLDESYTN